MSSRKTIDREDPWKVLGVSPHCNDQKRIKNAYKAKRRCLEDKGELERLRGSYTYVKGVLQQRAEAHQLMCEMEAIDAESSSGLQSSQQQAFDLQLANDNSVIEDEDFHVDSILNRMMQDRPTSTSYKTILNEVSSTQESHPCAGQPGAFGGFHELDGAAPILSDGNFMFVQGTSAAYQPGFASNLNVNMTDFNLINARAREKSLHGKLNKHQVKSYMTLREEALTAPEKKLSPSEFQNQLSSLEQDGLLAVSLEGKRNSRRVHEHLNKLSNQTRGKLLSYDDYRG